MAARTVCLTYLIEWIDQRGWGIWTIMAFCEEEEGEEEE